MPSPISRRSFLKRSGVLAGAACTSALATAPPAPARRSPEDLSAERERTYAALVAAVAAAQGARTSSRYVSLAAADFRHWYRSTLPHVRASIDATLDDVELQSGGGFSRISRARRLELLRTTGARATVAQAVVLASPPFSSEDDDGLRCSAAVV